MIFIILASAVILGEPVEIINGDCVKVERIQPAKPHPHKRVIVRHLFKADPKPVVEENCDGPRLPPLASIFPEPEGEFTPVPLAILVPPDLPVWSVPAVAAPECGCDLGGGSGVDFRGPWIGISGPIYTVAAPVAPVPEPSSWALVGLGLLIAGRRTAVVKRSI